MDQSVKQYLNRLDGKVDEVRQLTRTFCNGTHLTGFAYVRVYHDGRVGWVTSDSDHDRLLVDSGFLKEDPLIDTAKALEQGHYLWFHDRKFPGSKAFYKDRTRHFQIDHGMVVVSHQKDYLETGCFSGLLSKRPLYNVFSRKTGLFKAYLAHFRENLPRSMRPLLEEGIHLEDIKTVYGKGDSPEACDLLVAECGWGHLLKISKQERACLSLLREGLTYESIGLQLGLSPRTVESYFRSVKMKLDLETHADLCHVANRLFELGLI